VADQTDPEGPQDAQRPVPLPLPVTGVSAPAPGVPRRTLAIIIIAVVLLLLACLAVGVALAIGPLMTASRAALRGPAGTGGSLASSPGPTATDEKTLAQIKQRAVDDYPDFEFVRVDAGRDPESGNLWWVTLRSRTQPTVTYIATYEDFGDPHGEGALDVVNKDEVFRRGGDLSAHGPALLATVRREHADTPVSIQAVLLVEGSEDGRVPVDVLISRASTDGTPTGEGSWETYALDPATDAWARIPEMRDPGAASDPSLSDPAKDEQVARTFAEKAYPGYRVVDMVSRDIYRDGSPSFYAVLESKAVPGFRWVLDIDETGSGMALSVTNDFLAAKNRVRGDAFARAWIARHARTIVWEVTADDESMEVTANAIRVRYYDTAEQITSAGAQPREVDWRYDPKRKTWAEQP